MSIPRQDFGRIYERKVCMDNRIKLELTIEEVHSIMTAVENYRIHLINTAIKNGEDHRFDGTIERLGALDAALYRKLTNFLYDEVESSEKEDAPEEITGFISHRFNKVT